MAEKETGAPQKEVEAGPAAGTAQGANLLPGEEPKKEKGKSKLLIISIVAVGVLVLLIAIGVTLMLLMSPKKQADIISTEDEAEFVEQYKARVQASIDNPAESIYSPPLDYTANLHDGKHYIKISILLELKDPLALQYLVDRKPLIDDAMLTLLRSQSKADLDLRAGMDTLKLYIYGKVNGLFSDDFISLSESKDRNPVKDVLIKEFIVQ